jgi:hypothetical protein
MKPSRPIKFLAAAAMVLSSAVAYAESPVYPYFYPMEKAKGVYYPPGTPVLNAQGAVDKVDLGPFEIFEPIFGADPLTPHGGSPSPLMEGDATKIGVVGNHCTTHVTTCLLYHSAVQGDSCACRVRYGWRRGTITP